MPTADSETRDSDRAQLAEVAQRLDTIAEWLAAGCSRIEAIKNVQQLWGVCRRTDQYYLKKIEHRLALAAVKEDPLFYQRLGRVQRDHLLCKFNHYLQRAPELWDPKVLRALATAMNAARGLLDSRDRSMTAASKRTNPEADTGQATVRFLTAERKRLRERDKHLFQSNPEAPPQARGRVREPAGSSSSPRPSEREGPSYSPRPSGGEGPGVRGEPPLPYSPEVQAFLAGSESLAGTTPGGLPPHGVAHPAESRTVPRPTDPPLGSVAHIAIAPTQTPAKKGKSANPKPPKEKAPPAPDAPGCVPCVTQPSPDPANGPPAGDSPCS